MGDAREAGRRSAAEAAAHDHEAGGGALGAKDGGGGEQAEAGGGGAEQRPTGERTGHRGGSPDQRTAAKWLASAAISASV